MMSNLSQAANSLLFQVVMDLKIGQLRRGEALGLKRSELSLLQELSLEELSYLSQSDISVVNVSINHRNLVNMLQRARSETQRLQRIDRAIALGASIEMLACYFGLSTTDVASRRRIANITIRPGRATKLSDEVHAEIWHLYVKFGKPSLESDDGMDAMMLIAEQLNLALNPVWRSVQLWSTADAEFSSKKSSKKRKCDSSVGQENS